MNVRRLLTAVAVPVIAAGMAVAGIATPAQAVGVAPSEKCLTLDAQPVFCVTAGAEFEPATSGSTASGVLTITLNCRIGWSSCGIQPVKVTVNQTGYTPGTPPLGFQVVKVMDVHVPKACFDDICGPNAFDLPVYAPIVVGSAGTIWVNGTPVHLNIGELLGGTATIACKICQEISTTDILNRIVARTGIEEITFS